MAPYLAFMLDLAGSGDNRAIRKTIVDAPTGRLPDNAFVWKVICDAASTVLVIGATTNGHEVIAQARWAGDRLASPQQLEGRSVPTPYQWDLVETALRVELPARETRGVHAGSNTVESIESLLEQLRQRDRVFVDADRTAPVRAPREARRRSPARPMRWWPLVFVVPIAVFGGIVAILVAVHRPPQPAAPPIPVIASSPEPVRPAEDSIEDADSFDAAVRIARPELTGLDSPGAWRFTRYASAKLRWADVDVAPETTLGHVLKDVEAERGKRLCVEGTVVEIERRDVETRKTYAGRLRTDDGDEIAFVAVGSTGELVRKTRGRLCGAVVGKTGAVVAIVGMFDLPENRHPIVEQ